MTASKYLVAFLMVVESFSNKVYMDSAGYPTIGYGHKIRPGEHFPSPISEETARRLLIDDLKDAESAVNNLVKVPLSQGQYDALVDLTYNVGRGTFTSSGLLKVLNNGDYDEALRRLRMYNKERKNGELVVSIGLDWRRKMAEVFWRVADT
jgi:lysozyme